MNSFYNLQNLIRLVTPCTLIGYYLHLQGTLKWCNFPGDNTVPQPKALKLSFIAMKTSDLRCFWHVLIWLTHSTYFRLQMLDLIWRGWNCNLLQAVSMEQPICPVHTFAHSQNMLTTPIIFDGPEAVGFSKMLAKPNYCSILEYHQLYQINFCRYL